MTRALRSSLPLLLAYLASACATGAARRGVRVPAEDGGHTRARFNLGTLLRRTSPEEARQHLAVLRRQDPDLARLLEGQR